MREREGSRGWRGVAALQLLAAAILGAAPAAAQAAIALTPCRLSSPLASAHVAARCGTLEVPEDRARPGGRRISLAVAVVPAEAPQAAPAPVFVLAGGPGQAIREVFPLLAPAFGRIGRARDLVLVDQRGTGGSGRLACPALDAPERVLDDPAKEVAAVAACARSLDADLARYGTDDFVADLEAVREALGYARVDAIGFSYGTRAALAWARAHPARIRTLVLDGVVPFEEVVGGSFEEDGQAALDRLFRRCAAEPLCARSFPAPAAELRALAARLARRPERVRTRHPLTGAPLESTFGLDQLRGVVGAFLYQAETAAVLPPMLHAAASGDPGPLAAQGVAATADLEAGLSRPLQLSILCAEDVPLVVDAPPEADARRLLGRSVRDAFRRACAAWPVAAVRPAWRAPWRADVPALLLSGEADPVTPPRWADRLARDLPRARQVVLAGQGHGIFARGCVPRLVAEFLDAGGAEGLDLSCADAIRPPPPFVDFLGGAP
ncbi:MAG TPA: alpha/beta hydrolase [Anaeromyxobacteraceae bacterium]|nr:alpha/beta hydrolase [Anaeromyxobacteraceae bacterium]